MPIAVSCPSCDESLTLKDALAGKKVRCPGCSEVVQVPAEDEEDAPEESATTRPSSSRATSRRRDEEEDEAPPEREKAARKKKPRRVKAGGGAGLVIGLVLVLLLLIGGGVGAAVWYSNRADGGTGGTGGDGGASASKTSDAPPRGQGGVPVPVVDSPKVVVQKLAQEFCDAWFKGDFAKCASMYWTSKDGPVKDYATSQRYIWGSLNGNGFKLKNNTAGPAGDFHAEGGNTFCLVPTTRETAWGDNMTKGKTIMKNWLVGVSSDQGKTWAFFEYAFWTPQIAPAAKLRENIEKRIKLPATLVLPEPIKNEVVIE